MSPPCPRRPPAAARHHGRCRPLRGDSCPRVPGGDTIFFCGVNGWSVPTPSVGISPTTGPLCEGAGGDRWKLTRRRLLLLLAQFHLYFPDNSSSSALKLNKWGIFFSLLRNWRTVEFNRAGSGVVRLVLCPMKRVAHISAYFLAVILQKKSFKGCAIFGLNEKLLRMEKLRPFKYLMDGDPLNYLIAYYKRWLKMLW